MAEAFKTHEYWEFTRLSRWHIESDAMNRALVTVVKAQGPVADGSVLGMTGPCSYSSPICARKSFIRRKRWQASVGLASKSKRSYQLRAASSFA